jgi:hypothetical protein
MDNVRSTAASAAQTVVDAIDPSQDAGAKEKATNEPTFKDQLDQAAYSSRKEAGEPKKEETIMQKGMPYNHTTCTQGCSYGC